MHTEDDFLQGLRETPEDDDLRLVFSDWLEDQDDGRAEFLRLQVRRRRLPHDDPRQATLVSEQEALIRRCLSGWLAPLARFGVSILRGSGLLRVILTPQQLQELTPEDQGQSPWHWVDGLRVYGMTAENSEAAFAGPALGHFRHLDLAGNYLGAVGCRALACCPHLGNLRELNLEQTSLPWDTAAQLGEAAWMPRTRALNLAKNQLGPVGLGELIRRANFERLQILDLGFCELRPAGIDHLLAGRFFPQLQVLGLEFNAVGEEGAGKLLTRGIRHLRMLDLRGNNIRGEAAVRLRQQCAGVIL